MGLTGGLASGKSTVAAVFRDLGAYVLSSDEIARKLMDPGQSVYKRIVQTFGPEVVRADTSLDRSALARLAFSEGRADELNSIVHPATVALQNEIAAEIFRRDPSAIVVVESALIFETRFAGDDGGEGWRRRFDRMILVTAPRAAKIARFVARSGSGDRAALEADARRRLAQMIPDGEKTAACDFVIRNDGSLDDLHAQVFGVWERLQRSDHGAPSSSR